MENNSRIIISIDKQFYSEDDEIKIHVWFNYEFFSFASFVILSPTERVVDSAMLKTEKGITETFAFICGGPRMCENGQYKIRVECDSVVSETIFEYYNSQNLLNRTRDI